MGRQPVSASQPNRATESHTVDLTTLTDKRIHSGTFLGQVTEMTMSHVATALRVALELHD
jgi:hypothetical protein